MCVSLHRAVKTCCALKNCRIFSSHTVELGTGPGKKMNRRTRSIQQPCQKHQLNLKTTDPINSLSWKHHEGIILSVPPCHEPRSNVQYSFYFPRAFQKKKKIISRPLPVTLFSTFLTEVCCSCSTTILHGWDSICF